MKVPEIQICSIVLLWAPHSSFDTQVIFIGYRLPVSKYLKRLNKCCFWDFEKVIWKWEINLIFKVLKRWFFTLWRKNGTVPETKKHHIVGQASMSWTKPRGVTESIKHPWVLAEGSLFCITQFWKSDPPFALANQPRFYNMLIQR